MIAAAPRAWRRAGSSLALRLAVGLTLALLPLGLIALYQTWQILSTSWDLSETALTDRTEAAAARQRTAIDTAFGAAETLAATRKIFAKDEAGCRDAMRELVADSGTYTFAGYASADGRVLCSSDPSNALFAQNPFFRPQDAVPRRVVETVAEGPVSGLPALVLRVPVTEGGALQGYVSLAFPASLTAPAPQRSARPVKLVMFNAAGTLLTSAHEATAMADILPKNRSLADLAAAPPRPFRGESDGGDARDFAVVPIVPQTAYVLGSWRPQGRLASLGLAGAVALFFPLLMWAISVFVAYFGINRLVVRHVRRLQRRMLRYSEGSSEFAAVELDNAPEELEDVAESFRNMASRVAENERRRAEDLREKTVLLKEVHHRVKNNLQLISSLISMQRRRTTDDDAEQLLRRIQDRVMALSTIHRNIYMSRNLSMVRADQMLRELLEQIVAIGEADGDRQISVSAQLEPVEMSPDQAVPLALILTEAATNAVKYCGLPAEGGRWIAVTLSRTGPRQAALAVSNSRGGGRSAPCDAGEDGLGSSLIASFASQLGGRIEIDKRMDRYDLVLTLDIRDADPDLLECDPAVPA